MGSRATDLRYGRIRLGGRGTRKIPVHHAGWLLTHGELPDREHGEQLHHRCYNTLCWNPLHLDLTDNQTNTLDAFRKLRETRLEPEPDTWERASPLEW